MSLRTTIFAALLLLAAVESSVLLNRNSFAYGSLNNELTPSFDYADGDNDRPTDHAQIARRIVHKSEWTALGTNSAAKELAGFPMVNIISMADSKRGALSTGNIYFLLTNLDFTGQDLMKINRLTMLFSQDQDMECSKQGVDPMEPTCARIIISGRVIQMKNDTAEYQFGFDAFVDRHPAAVNWIKEHNFYLCKVDIASIIVLDWYGGPHHVTVEDYFRHNDTSMTTTTAVGGDGFREKRKIRIHVEQATNDVVLEL